jgi:cytochrome c oxidase accessory protein FixG
MRLDDANFSMEKLVKKWYKHIIWIFFSIWTGFTFVGYFTPIRELAMEFFQTQMSSWELFWVFFYAFATYGNAGFMREQICKYMCPYARFQSAMFDNDTLIVTYDAERGEPRGPRAKSADIGTLNLGACVDCTLCVQVCPTGIDIRDGLQYECIGCGACADVCDTVMDKLGYAKGLVRYSTQNAMDNKWTPQQIWKQLMRPRIQIYTMILVAITVGLFVSLSLRTPFKVDVVRDRSTLSRITEYGTLENVYRLQIMNAAEHEQTYQLNVKGLPQLKITTQTVVKVDPAQARWIVLSADIPYGSSDAGSHKIEFEVRALGTDNVVFEKSVFIVPR